MEEDGERGDYKRRLGFTLSRLRTALDPALTQERVAEALGVDAETVGRWERGDREPKAYDLHRLATLYQAPPEWLLAPSDSLSEVDARLAWLRREAAEAAQRAVEAEIGPPDVAERPPRRGKPRA